MTSKAYRLANGIVLETEAELKAYIRGLETARSASEACTNGRQEFLGKMAQAIEEANIVKQRGLTNEAGKTDAEVEAEQAAAEKPAEEKAVDAPAAEA